MLHLLTQPMCADYGFRSGSGRLYQEHYGETPKGVLDLVREGGALHASKLEIY